MDEDGDSTIVDVVVRIDSNGRAILFFPRIRALPGSLYSYDICNGFREAPDSEYDASHAPRTVQDRMEAGAFLSYYRRMVNPAHVELRFLSNVTQKMKEEVWGWR